MTALSSPLRAAALQQAVRPTASHRIVMTTTHSNPSRRDQEMVAARYLEIARRMAAGIKKRLPAHVEVDDLVGAASVALAKVLAGPPQALESASFERYIRCRMRGAMLDELRRKDTMSNSQRADLERLRSAERSLTHQLGHRPDRDAVASAAGLTRERCERLAEMVASRSVTSLDATTASFAARQAAVPMESALDVRRKFERLDRAMRTLPDRLQLVIQLYYRKEMTLRQIGDELGVTESRVLQLRQNAEKRLRSATPASNGQALAAAS